MSRSLKTGISIVLAVLLVGLGVLINKQNARAVIGVGYKTKVACSEVFVAKRQLDDVLAHDFFNIDPMFDKIKINVDMESKTVRGSLFGLGKSMAVYRDGVGCTVFAQKGVAPANVPIVTDADKLAAHTYDINMNANVQEKVLALFDDEALAHPIVTRSAVVIQDGKIVGEHYAGGFHKDTRQQSWSMAKGITQSLVGIMTGRGLLSLNDKALLKNWQGDDRRAQINLGDLLHMASGLAFSEEYANTNSDVVQMLFNSKDMAAYAASLPLIYEAGKKSVYASGTTNIVSKIIRMRLEAAGQNYHEFPRRALFDKIGMMSAIFEVDPSGIFIGSSYVYAVARDYARFGQLYLQEGEWQGEQVLPLGWTDYTRQPAARRNDYGSHWSLNLDGMTFAGLPKDVIALGGNDGQYIFVIPSKNAVIVRLGILRTPASVNDDLLPLILDIYKAL